MPLVRIEETAKGELVVTCEEGGEAGFIPAPGVGQAEAIRNALKVLDATCSCGGTHQEAR